MFRPIATTALLALASGVCLPALAGPMPVARRTAGVLASDLTLDAIFILRDLNGDNDATDPGETQVFFDSSNASGVAAPTGAVFAMYQQSDGTIFFTDNDTRSVYAIKDNNRDGDALDAGEARVWYGGGLFSLVTPNGISGGPDNAIYVSNAGTATFPQDAIFRTADLDNDGAASSPGEITVFADFASVANSSPFGISYATGGAPTVPPAFFVADLRGSSADVIFRVRDIDNNGTVDPAEIVEFYVDGTFMAPASFTAVADSAGSIYVHESTSSVAPQTVYRLTDLDDSGTINSSSEAVEVWNEGDLTPLAGAMSNSFDISVGADASAHARLAISSNGGDPVDEVIVGTDLNNDGDFNDAGETAVWIQGTAVVGFPENIRSVLWIGQPCPADFNNTGSVTVQDIFDFLNAYFSNSPSADVNGQGGVTVQDIFDFLNFYFSGC